MESPSPLSSKFEVDIVQSLHEYIETFSSWRAYIDHIKSNQLPNHYNEIHELYQELNQGHKIHQLPGLNC